MFQFLLLGDCFFCGKNYIEGKDVETRFIACPLTLKHMSDNCFGDAINLPAGRQVAVST